MRKRRFSAGEIRFRASKQDLERLEWLLDHQAEQNASTLLRQLILREYERLQPKILSH